MQITVAELKLNMRKYLEMAAEQDIFITENGRRIARLTSPSMNRVAKAENTTPDDIKRERLKKTGVWNGMPYYVADDFDEPLKDFAEYM